MNEWGTLNYNDSLMFWEKQEVDLNISFYISQCFYNRNHLPTYLPRNRLTSEATVNFTRSGSDHFLLPFLQSFAVFDAPSPLFDFDCLRCWSSFWSLFFPVDWNFLFSGVLSRACICFSVLPFCLCYLEEHHVDDKWGYLLHASVLCWSSKLICIPLALWQLEV